MIFDVVASIFNSIAKCANNIVSTISLFIGNIHILKYHKHNEFIQDILKKRKHCVFLKALRVINLQFIKRYCCFTIEILYLELR